MTQIIDISTKERYEITPARNGEANITCPACSKTRKDKKGRCFQWNESKGVGQCYNCGRAFVKYDPLRSSRSKEYIVPEWRNKTELSDKAVKWFEGRMISQDTLRKMRVFSDREYMPQFGGEVDVMCFPFFRNGEQVNIKFRGPNKSFKLVSGAELIFYNLDCAKSNNEIVIVEGEIDALTFVECGITNVVSVPNGAGARDMSYLDSCIESLSHIETFYVAVDQDEPGMNLRQELVRRLGAEKCRIVDFLDCKDANEFFKKYFKDGIVNAVRSARQLPIPGIHDIHEDYESARDVYMGKTNAGYSIGVDSIDKLVKWRPGQLVVWTGIPSHGKSAMLNFMAAKWNTRFGWKVAYFSPENMPYDAYLYPGIVSQLVGKEFRKESMSEAEFDQSFEYVCDNFFFIGTGDDYTVESILKTAKALVRQKGIRVLIIDPFNCFEHRRGGSESETEYIGRFLDSLVRFARNNDVLVNLVAHPRKMEKLNGYIYQRPTLYDINGSANFFNKLDVGITVYRRFDDHPSGPGTEFIVSKVRFRDYGETGSAELHYNLRNGRYDVNSDVTLKDNSNWINPGEANFPFSSHPTPFDNDDCPF